MSSKFSTKEFLSPVDPLQLIEVSVRVVKKGVCHGGDVTRRWSITLGYNVVFHQFKIVQTWQTTNASILEFLEDRGLATVTEGKNNRSWLKIKDNMGTWKSP